LNRTRTAAVIVCVFALLGTHAQAAEFSAPARITNKWTPMPPGLALTFKGEVNGAEGRHPHLDIFIVTGLTKVIDGIRTRVIWDRDIDEGSLQESELAFEAQDDRGNVRNMGEYPELYEDGHLQGAPSTWIAGIGDAKAGLLMHANPHLGTPAYLQGLSPSIGFKDKAVVYRVDQATCVPVGCFAHVLVTKEWNTYQPDEGFQLKYYAPGLGNVNIAPLGGNETEVLKLVKIEHLSRTELHRIDAKVLEIDERGRSTNTTYAQTLPAS
jgi:hypothetical protein